MTEIVMPRLSDSMEEGTIIRWLKAEGEAVVRGDELVEIETDKATMTYESDAAGTLEILAQDGDTLPVGSPIARLGDGTASAPAPAAAPAAPPAPPAPVAAAPEGQSAAPEITLAAPAVAVDAEALAQSAPAAQPPAEARPAAPARDERIKASPVARRIARERGVDLASLTGTGPGGRIVKSDVESAGTSTRAPAPAEAPAAPTPAPAPAVSSAPPASGAAATGRGDVTTTELTRTQSLIARRMAESRATVPTFTLRATLDMTSCVQLRTDLKAALSDDQGPLPSYNDLVVKACAIALREHPRANGAYKDATFEHYGRVNVGVAVAAQDTLVVPTIFDADVKGLSQIAGEARALAQRVREGTITPPELSGATFTVSNLGMFGVRSFEAIINPPQAAILSVGALEPRPAVRDGEVVIRQQMDVELACDHRILYGAQAAEFLARIRSVLENPLSLAL